MENLIVYLCNDKPVKLRKSRKSRKTRKNTKKKILVQEAKEHDSKLNQDLKNDIKNLRFSLENMKQEDQQDQFKQEPILTPRSKERSENLKRKMNFLKRSQSLYEYKKR